MLFRSNESPVNEIFITLDCCHSGAFGTTPLISNDKIILSEGVSIITATRSGQEALEEGEELHMQLGGRGVITLFCQGGELVDGGGDDIRRHADDTGRADGHQRQGQGIIAGQDGDGA